MDEELNANHELVIVASELDAATERIVQYLNRHGIGINVLFFRVFEHPVDSCSVAPGLSIQSIRPAPNRLGQVTRAVER